MLHLDIPVPHLTTAHFGPLTQIEKILLSRVSCIETWFRQKWQETPAPLTSSVDLRHAGFKLAPVDTNLFPAGFNNLNPDFLSICVQAAQATLSDYAPACKNILLLPENHTRNRFYLQSLSVLQNILQKAGFNVRIGSLDALLTEPMEVVTDLGDVLFIEPIKRNGSELALANFKPCMLILNNDLSAGVPAILEGISQPIRPSSKLGWSSRLKSSHFRFYEVVVQEFSELLGFDPWLIKPLFKAVDTIDFMAQDGLDKLAHEADLLLKSIEEKYTALGIQEAPFVVIKADNGTYGMSVMMVNEAEELKSLNRKQRTRMSTSKGGQKVNKIILQEGIYTFETMQSGAVAEPVVYLIGPYVIGGFYRVHQDRGIDENLNAPGMHFVPLAFAKPCNIPEASAGETLDFPNRFYTYGVIARLAALAAAREIAATGDA